MAKMMCCPYFEREIKKRNEFVGVKCKAATINFPSKNARRCFVYPLCGSIEGYVKCPIFQFLREEEINGNS